MTAKLIIIGMGGHSKVAADVARRSGYELLGFLDNREPAVPHGAYLGPVDDFPYEEHRDTQFFVGIGSNAVRQKVAGRLAARGVEFATLIDPSAILGSGVMIGSGTLVMPGCIINADSRIGQQVILNTAATVDHDCVVGDYAHLSPGVHLAGAVQIGALTHVGIGASVIQTVQIGARAVIGAGAAVVRNIPDDVTAVGVPAKVIKTNS
ncbi:acetyltransferase [Tumebacillus avium]|nr:acetyltransferase [Tumebacillus avium]